MRQANIRRAAWECADKQLIAVIKAYYLDGKEAMEKMIESLY